jgi:hypothetical protein
MAQQVPPWLGAFQPGEAFEREQFFASRIVYYPGSGTDGQPVQLFGSTHSAHSFVYADYGLTKAAVEAALEHPKHRFLGYHTLASLDLTEFDLLPDGWIPHITYPAEVALFAGASPFIFLVVLERDPEFDDNHGPRRLAILFLGADGIATYDALFCQEGRKSTPFAVVLQDHGFGMNWNKFGGGGLLEHVAMLCNVIPRWLLVAENTQSWEGFERVPGVGEDRGGEHATLRFLYELRKKK